MILMYNLIFTQAEASSATCSWIEPGAGFTDAQAEATLHRQFTFKAVQHREHILVLELGFIGLPLIQVQASRGASCHLLLQELFEGNQGQLQLIYGCPLALIETWHVFHPTYRRIQDLSCFCHTDKL